ncbi:MAG: 4-alpha-glucanotransferase [Thermomicrobiales bacterium]|nr:4-alpha-glucanotransferase [Thermomicrobiales bacterium]
MQFPRESGILLHPTSLPGDFGIGDFGGSAYRFVDWLEASGQRLWQVMPLGPVGYGDSPYSATSAFAGNPLLVSLSVLIGDGLLTDADLVDASDFPEARVDWELVRPWRWNKLRLAYDRLHDNPMLMAEFVRFLDVAPQWLHDYTLFVSLKDHFGGGWWLDWPADIRAHEGAAIEHWTVELAPEIRFQSFVQFLFQRQWHTLRTYANQRGIRLIGDIPIFVALDSADVWANQHQFNFDANGQPTWVAGVPPDYFSPTGQRWGNPTYNWPVMQSDGFSWWVERFRAVRDLVDIIRIDHFRGFAAAWHVPGTDDTAANGHWELAPGAEVFAAARRAIGEFPVIVEDLGLITADVVTLREILGFPGMNVLHFAFDGDPSNSYLPHNQLRHSVTYTATHDNQTTIGWWESQGDDAQERVRHYLGHPVADPAWDLLRVALSSVSNTAIIPMQDVLRLGDEARMNTPATTWGNWGWMMTPAQLDFGLAQGLRDLTSTYGRISDDYPPRTVSEFDYSSPFSGITATRSW